MTAVASMDDLVSALNGNVHVSQDGYELKALQDYLSRTIVIPDLPSSPASHFRPLPPSRSASSTRMQSAPQPEQAYDYQPTGYFHSAEDVSMATSAQRPAALRRTSSYGGEAISESEFRNDAFAPLFAQSAPSDPWRAFSQKQSVWGSFNNTAAARPQPQFQSSFQPSFQQTYPTSFQSSFQSNFAGKKEEPRVTVNTVSMTDDESMDEDMAQNVDEDNAVMAIEASNRPANDWQRGRW